VTAAGYGFPAEAQILLRWSPGLGHGVVRSDARGSFRLGVLVFRRDVPGRRRLVATMVAPTPSATFTPVGAPFLVVRGTSMPFDFVQRR
jgi:hypothetical protein